MNTFHLDIITPTSTHTFENISYLRIPGLDGLIGIEANHANAIIALDIGEIKINFDGKILYFSTSGGFTDIQSKGVQLLLETFEESKNIDKKRAEESFKKAKERLGDKAQNFERANQSLQRAKNRISVFNKK
jgi:F-type H+-transporting ATPase subunit epsilon